MSKVRRSIGCWDWRASKQPTGYGQFRLGGTTVGAHRASWMLHRGPIPPGKHVLHTCDNRACVNPEHLFIGTNDDNVRDKCAKGRHPTKLKAADVRRIRALDAASLAHLGRQFGVSPRAIDKIRRRELWSDI